MMEVNPTIKTIISAIEELIAYSRHTQSISVLVILMTTSKVNATGSRISTP